ncbi:ABC transporter permease [Agromyces sp. NPDC049794]|uniref:ABC transporter permease n=1 Tax=unclassified Agromyces TaxID=2639701 RepID=UPI0033CBC35D
MSTFTSPIRKTEPDGESTSAFATLAVKRSRKKSTRRRALWLGLAGVLGLIAILEIVSRLGLVDPQFLPPFSTVIMTMIGLFADPSFLMVVGSTLLTWLLGLSISALLGIPLGFLLGLSGRTYRATRTVFELVRTLPAVALIPLVIMIAGNGLEMKLIIAVYAAIWPILFNTIYGVRGTDPKATEMARSFTLGGAEIIRRIVLPSAAPFIATGIRVSSSIVLIVIITVELIAGGATGLGAFISQMRVQGDRVQEVYAGILVAGLLGLAINVLLGILERRFFSWDTTTRGGV